jgi:hypothetical protein
MTNIFGTPDKVKMKALLFEAAVQALEQEGWKVERVQGSGKSSVRRITKGAVSKLISIRTTQDAWIAFPRTEGDKGWRTLDEVELVVPVSVDDPDNPKFAKVHMIDANEMRDRFNRAYAARMKAEYSIPIGRGVWVSLYLPEAQDPITQVGAGAGLKFPPIATVPLNADATEGAAAGAERPMQADPPLTIAEAKRRLAITFGVDPANIKITVEA